MHTGLLPPGNVLDLGDLGGGEELSFENILKFRREEECCKRYRSFLLRFTLCIRLNLRWPFRFFVFIRATSQAVM
jgi:hypothetical protein